MGGMPNSEFRTWNDLQNRNDAKTSVAHLSWAHSCFLRHSSLELRHSLQFQIDQTVRRDDAVFLFHVLARAKIDSSTGVFNKERAGGDIPQTDSCFDVCVQSSAGDVRRVERCAAE